MNTTFKLTLILLLFNIFGSHISNCQIVLEHDYDSAAWSAPSLKYVQFQANGEKYVNVRYPRVLSGVYPNRKIEIYDLNHSLVKTIPLNGINFYPDSVNASYCILYISDNLFNNDSLIEFLFTIHRNVFVNNNFVIQNETYIYNENLSLLFSDPIAGPWLNFSETPQTYLPIINTSAGTKMIINSGYPDYKERVYGLPGQLLTSGNQYTQDMAGQNDNGNVNIFPNPSQDFTTVGYDLPNNIEKADLVFYDLNGKRIKSFAIDHTFHDLQLTTKDLSAGTYYCQMESNSSIIRGKKFVVIH